MKGSECRLIECMEGSKKRFIIPVYQRNYDWKTENCKQLYDDLIKVIKHNRRSHFFGNLTLTEYNSKYSNNSFIEKKTMENGFDDSGIRMNTYIAKKENWTLKELEERNEHLMGRALTIWARPTTAFQPEEKQLDAYTLEDDEMLSGRLIARFSYKNNVETYEVGDNKDVIMVI